MVQKELMGSVRVISELMHKACFILDQLVQPAAFLLLLGKKPCSPVAP